MKKFKTGGGAQGLTPAFTLAEVLVTLGIIGVISALTLPTLMKNHQRKVYVTQLQKVYNELSQAFERKITDSNAVNLREAGLVEDRTYAAHKTFLNNYFNVVKVCGKDLTPCFAAEYTNSLGGAFNGDRGVYPVKSWVGTTYNVTLASGAAIGITYDMYYVLVDINGAQGPNIYCRDLFKLGIKKDGTLGSACVNRLIEKGWVMDEDYDNDPTGTH